MKRNKPAFLSQRGTTLVEHVICMSVFALIAVAGTGALTKDSCKSFNRVSLLLITGRRDGFILAGLGGGSGSTIPACDIDPSKNIDFKDGTIPVSR